MNKDNLSSILPDNPHRQLYALITILIFVSIVGGIVLYQIKNTEEDYQTPVITMKTTPIELTDAQREKAIMNLNETISKSPPLTDKQRAKAIYELNKAVANQNK